MPVYGDIFFRGGGGGGWWLAKDLSLFSCFVCACEGGGRLIFMIIFGVGLSLRIKKNESTTPPGRSMVSQCYRGVR